jgi:hypothetical protein
MLDSMNVPLPVPGVTQPVSDMVLSVADGADGVDGVDGVVCVDGVAGSFGVDGVDVDGGFCALRTATSPTVAVRVETTCLNCIFGVSLTSVIIRYGNS